MRRSLTRLVPAAVLALAVAGLPACGSSGGGGTITVLSFWTGPERDWFVGHVLAEFTRETGIQVHYQLGTRAIDQELQSDLQTGTQPDIAVLPSPGDLEAFAQQGALQPLDSALADQSGRYSQQWLSLESSIQPVGGGRHKYAVPISIGVKSVIWYDPSALRRLLGSSWTGAMPTTWDQLTALTNAIGAHGGTPWCMGMESTPVSGWPGTDWIEDILLHQSGPLVYQRWADGVLSWQKSPEIDSALAAFGSILAGGRNVNGGVDGALLTDFSDASKLLFTAKPGCYLDHDFGVNPAETLRPGVDFDFFPFPAINGRYANTYEVSADFAVMFRQSPQAERLIQFLASDAAQRLWVTVPGVRGVLSADRNVGVTSYPDSVTRRAAQLVSSASSLCFDGSDVMPPSVRAAFYQAVLTYLGDPARYQNPAELSQLLGELDSSQAAAGSTLTYQCGQ